VNFTLLPFQEVTSAKATEAIRLSMAEAARQALAVLADFANSVTGAVRARSAPPAPRMLPPLKLMPAAGFGPSPAPPIRRWR